MFYSQYIAYIQEFGAELLNLYTLQDYIEVTFFIFITHKALFWLKQDHTKHLLLTSYAYFSLLATTYLTSCSVLFVTLLLIAPAYIVFCIVIHQKQLQKNFISSSKKYFTPHTAPPKNWLENLIQSCLIASHNKKNITCIIERNQSLQALLNATITLQTPIQKKTTNFILASEKIDQNCLLWTQSSGIIQGINVQWSSFLTDEILVKPKDTLALYYEAALLLTEKTDAIIFAINTTSDMHTIWYQGKCIQQVSVQQLLNFIKKIIQEPIEHKNQIIKGKHYDQQHTTSP